MDSNAHQPQAATSTQVTRANQRLLCINLLAIVLAIIASTGAILAVVLTPVHTSAENAIGGTTLLDRDGEVVATATIEEAVDLAELPSQGADSTLYSQIKRVGWTTTNGARMGFTVSGYVWYNLTDMDIYLDAGYTMHIAGGADGLSVSDGIVLPEMAGGIAQRRRLERQLWAWVAPAVVWAVRIYTITHGSGHNGEDNDETSGGKTEESGADTEADKDEDTPNEADGGTGVWDPSGSSGCPPGVICRRLHTKSLTGIK